MSAEIRACRCTDFWAFHHPDCPAMQTIRRLRAELAECRRDAERYRWLVKNSTYCPADTPPILAPVANRIWYHATNDTVNDSLDSVIDAALAGAKENDDV